MTWLKASDYVMPDKAASPADFILAYEVRSDLIGADDNFVKVISPNYENPETYIESMITWALSIQQYSPRFCPPGWNPTQAAIAACFSCFDMLKKMDAHPLDPTNTQSIYDVWTKVPPPANVTPPSDPNNPSTGQSAAPPNTIL